MDTLAGHTIRWTATDGSTAGITFEHDFHADGSVEWRALNGAYQGAHRLEKHYGAIQIDPNTWLVSYLAESGHTLTVALNFANHQAAGFGSNEKKWEPFHGTFEVVK